MAELANWPRARKPTTTPIRTAAAAMAARAKSILTCLPPGLMMRPEVRVLELKRLRTPASCPLLEQGRVDAALSMIRTGVVTGTWTGDGVLVSTASLRRGQKPVKERVHSAWTVPATESPGWLPLLGPEPLLSRLLATGFVAVALCCRPAGAHVPTNLRVEPVTSQQGVGALSAESRVRPPRERDTVLQ